MLLNLDWFIVFSGWFSVILFLIIVCYKVIKYATMPLHLRWELYPVAHEPEPRRNYGGSYMEEVDWVKRPRHRSLTGEIKEMGSEIFFLKRVKDHNPYNLWPLSMSMHWGIYLLLTWIFLLVTEGLFGVKSISQITNIVGSTAFILGLVGSLSLIIVRSINRELRLYTAPVDYFNLLFLFSIFLTGIISFVMDSSFTYHRDYIKGILSFKPVSLPPVVFLNLLLFELFIIYMPFSKMLHYIAKYFTFHKILWDDTFKVKGSPVDRKVLKQLSYKVSWAGPHIVPDKTWLEEAQIMTERERNE